jgi:hypothetical protein
MKYCILIAIVLRLAVWWAMPADQLCQPDSATYIRAAYSFFDHGKHATQPETFRTPGYPAIVWLCKYDPLCITLVQCILSCLAVAILFRLRFALAAWLYAFDPLSIIYANVMLSETIFTLALAILYLCLVERRSAVLCAVILAACAYIRPIALFAAPPLALWLWWIGGRPWKFLYVYALCIAPWMIRNHIVADTWEFSTVASYNAATMGWGITLELTGLARKLFGGGYMYIKKLSASVPHAVPMIHNLTLMALAATGAWIGRKDKRIVLAVLIIAYFILIPTGRYGYSRFRVPVIPFLCILAHYGCMAITTRRTS